MPKEPEYIVLGVNSNQHAFLFGTRQGKPFTTERSADRRKRKMDKRYPHLDLITLPITATDLDGTIANTEEQDG